MDYLLNVSYGGLRANTLESIFNEETLLHLLIHFHLVVLAPHLLNHEVLSQLHLVLVLIFVSGSLSNLRLPLNAIHALLQSILLVFDACLE
jgi:hypothetical protein